MVNQEIIHKTFDLIGCDVTKLEFNYSIRILIADASNSVSILIESELLLEIEGIETRLDPGKEVNAVLMAPLLNLLHKPAKLVTFSSNSSLRLEMVDGTIISVLKDDNIGWEAYGGGSFADIAMLCDRTDIPPWEEK